MYAKRSGRVAFRSNRRQGYKRNSNFSNGKVRNKGNVTQQYQKYIKLAKEASSSGDRVQAEYYYQFADHYFRLIKELGIVFEDNENNPNAVETKLDEPKENKSVIPSNSSTQNAEDVTEENDHESIESVSFISQSVKKKSSKAKKESV